MARGGGPGMSAIFSLGGPTIQWQLVYSSMLEARDSSDNALQLLTRQVVESTVESVLWKEDGRVALVEKAYYFLTEKS